MENISTEVATGFFEEWAEGADVDTDETDFSEEEQASFRAHRRRIIKGFQNGQLEMDTDGHIVLTPLRSPDVLNPITFKPRTGASLMAADRKQKNQEAAKTYAIMSDLTGQPAKVLSRLVGLDAKVAESIFILLMA